jgi:hypothetical protein
MYAAIENKREILLKFEKLEWFEKKLKSLDAAYQLVIARRMFDLAHMAEFQFALVKWVRTSMEYKRTLVLETTDLEQMESALFMLINVEEENRRS